MRRVNQCLLLCTPHTLQGRKPILFSSIFIFLVRTSVSLLNGRALTCVVKIGSALCGAAQNMTWLVVARAVQGIGGGGIVQLVQITISDIVSLQEYVYLLHVSLRIYSSYTHR